MVGSACAQMGLFGEGIRRLDQAIDGPIPAARRAAEFCKGLTLREMGNEQEARVIFERIYSEEPGFEANAAALRDPKYRSDHHVQGDDRLAHRQVGSGQRP